MTVLAEIEATMPVYVGPPLTVTDSVRYQGASGDMNPMHHDADRARARGYRDAFTVGMLPAGILGARVSGWLAAGEVLRFKTSFRAQVWPGDELTYEAAISDRRSVEGGTEVAISMTVTNQDGQVCLTGEGDWLFADGS
jgi:acyl dehydratase